MLVCHALAIHLKITPHCLLLCTLMTEKNIFEVFLGNIYEKYPYH